MVNTQKIINKCLGKNNEKIKGYPRLDQCKSCKKPYMKPESGEDWYCPNCGIKKMER